MPTYEQIYDMRANGTFGKQVAVACRVAAEAILNEAPSVSNHIIRAKWAGRILAGNDTLIARMVSVAALNTTLQLTAPAGPWSDNDVQFVVNSQIDAQIAMLSDFNG